MHALSTCIAIVLSTPTAVFARARARGVSFVVLRAFDIVLLLRAFAAPDLRLVRSRAPRRSFFVRRARRAFAARFGKRCALARSRRRAGARATWIRTALRRTSAIDR